MLYLGILRTQAGFLFSWYSLVSRWSLRPHLRGLLKCTRSLQTSPSWSIWWSVEWWEPRFQVPRSYIRRWAKGLGIIRRSDRADWTRCLTCRYRGAPIVDWHRQGPKVWTGKNSNAQLPLEANLQKVSVKVFRSIDLNHNLEKEALLNHFYLVQFILIMVHATCLSQYPFPNRTLFKTWSIIRNPYITTKPCQR